MTAPVILQDLKALNILISLEGGNLKVTGRKDLMTPELVARLKAEKPQIIAWLAALETAPLLPLTDMQLAYLVGREDGLGLGGVSSHVYHEFDGHWDIAKLQAALAATVARHDALRMVITAEGALILPSDIVTPEIALEDLSAIAASDQDDILLQKRAEMSHQVLPAGRGCLVDLRLSVLGPQRMRLHVSHDGLVMDGLSMLSFFADLGAAYQGHGLPTLDADFASQLDLLAQGTGDVEAASNYWVDKVPDLPAAPDLPLASDPSKLAAPRSERYTARLCQNNWQQFQDAAKTLGLSPSAALGAAFSEVLSLWSGGMDLSLNMTIANRIPTNADVFSVIGNFTQPCPVPYYATPKTTIADRALQFAKSLRDGVEHRHLSGVSVLGWMARKGAEGLALPITLNCAFGAPDAERCRHAFDAFGTRVYAISQTPQVWLNAFAFETPAGLEIEIDAVAGLFPDGLIQDAVLALTTLLEQLGDLSVWDTTSLDLLPTSTRESRDRANATTAEIPTGLLHDAFIAQALAVPDAPAVIGDNETVTYGALLDRAAGIAIWLRARNLPQQALVAVVMQKGWEQIAASLGILMAGGAYMPVDATFPKNRVQAILARGDAAAVLTQPDISIALPDALVKEDICVVDKSLTGDVVPFSADHRPPQMPDSLAYVLFTSGSTGAPKGVMVSHSNAINLVTDINARFDVKSKDRLFGISAHNFDLSVYDIFGALTAGAAIVLPRPDETLDSHAWAVRATQGGVTIWNSVPAIAQMLVESDLPLPPDLRLIMMSGDKIPAELPAVLTAVKPDLQVMSLGGPTETTVWNILHDVTDLPANAPIVPYGKPNANNRYYVLDRMGRPCPNWVTGELHAAGAGVARGYWKDPQRTKAAFYEHSGLQERVYATGDVGRYRPDGVIEILGRKDFQVKINGLRIELTEIETLLSVHPMIQTAVAAAIDGADGKRLAALVVPEAGKTVDADMLRTYLSDVLPDYMIPSAFEISDSLPLTTNGKVDRAAISALQFATGETATTQDARAPEGAIEVSIAAIWEGVLKTTINNAHDTLEDLGGTSLSAVRITTEINRQLGVRLPIRKLGRLNTVHAQAVHVSDKTAARTAAE